MFSARGLSVIKAISLRLPHHTVNSLGGVSVLRALSSRLPVHHTANSSIKLLQQTTAYCVQFPRAKGSYSRVVDETLESLNEKFDELFEDLEIFKTADATLADGVLNIKLGETGGIYVINKQSPNQQIWLSSPTSGPARFDWILEEGGDGGRWLYNHTGETLHQLLDREFEDIIKSDPGFVRDCYMGGGE